jgi:hypothetical protein
MNDHPPAPKNPEAELVTLLDRARTLAQGLSSNARLEEASDVDTLQNELDEARTENARLAEELVEMERRLHRLSGLQVTTYELHSTRDLERVQQTVAHAARDLLGARRYVLLLRDGHESPCKVVLADGFEGDLPEPYGEEDYAGGVDAVDQALATGARHFDLDNRPAVVVPLRYQDHVVGALVLEEVAQGSSLSGGLDSEILDLFAAHAASALLACHAEASTERKLETLETLVRIARGSS